MSDTLTMVLADSLPVREGGAARADRKAEELTDAEYTPDEGKSCEICKGTGTMQVKTVQEGKPDDWCSMQCYRCAGKGTQNANDLYSSLYHKNVWCHCEENTDSVVAKDGRAVFGNDTYLCSVCGMVTQFG